MQDIRDIWMRSFGGILVNVGTIGCLVLMLMICLLGSCMFVLPVARNVVVSGDSVPGAVAREWGIGPTPTPSGLFGSGWGPNFSPKFPCLPQLGGLGCPPPVPVVTVNADSWVPFNGGTKLTWSATNADSCKVDGRDEKSSGSRQLTGLLATGRILVKCKGAGGEGEAAVEIQVGLPFQGQPGTAAALTPIATPAAGAPKAGAPVGPTATLRFGETRTPIAASATITASATMTPTIRAFAGNLSVSGGLTENGTFPCWKGNLYPETMRVFGDRVELTARLKIMSGTNCAPTSLSAALQVGPTTTLEQKDGGVGPYRPEIEGRAEKVITWTFSGTAPDPAQVKICSTNWAWLNGAKCQELK